jgi:hypothetical protein
MENLVVFPATPAMGLAIAAMANWTTPR